MWQPRLTVGSCLGCGLSVFLLLALAGCGSQSYGDGARAAISHLRSAIQAYNRAKPANLGGEARACRQAQESVQSGQAALLRQSPPARYAAAVGAVRRAYRLARDAFLRCFRAAQTLNYPLMAQAESEVALANASIARARKLDR